jgi:hypothetical protein
MALGVSRTSLLGLPAELRLEIFSYFSEPLRFHVDSAGQDLDPRKGTLHTRDSAIRLTPCIPLSALPHASQVWSLTIRSVRTWVENPPIVLQYEEYASFS